jgi:O-antigen ligase
MGGNLAKLPRLERQRLEAVGSSQFVKRCIIVAMILCIVQPGRPKLSTLAEIAGYICCIVEWRQALRLLRRAEPLCLMLLIALASFGWSVSRDDTLPKLAELFGVCAISLYAVASLDRKALIETLATAIAATALVSVVLIIAIPGIGIQPDGVPKGMYSYKTQLGLGMMWGIITTTCAAFGANGRSRWFYVAGLVMCVGVLSRANSITGVLGSVSFCAFLPLLLWSRRRRLVAMPFFGVAALGLIVLVAQSSLVQPLFDLVGRDSTLTGRTEIWEGVSAANATQPLLGFGYGAFWSDSGPWQTFVDSSWEPGAAHNGYLETMLNYGIIGEIALWIFIGFGIYRAARTYWRGSDVASVWPLCLLLVAIIANYAEATFMYPRIDWLSIMAAFLVVSNDTVQSSTDATVASSSQVRKSQSVQSTSRKRANRQPI